MLLRLRVQIFDFQDCECETFLMFGIVSCIWDVFFDLFDDGGRPIFPTIHGSPLCVLSPLIFTGPPPSGWPSTSSRYRKLSKQRLGLLPRGYPQKRQETPREILGQTRKQARFSNPEEKNLAPESKRDPFLDSSLLCLVPSLARYLNDARRVALWRGWPPL